MHLFHPALQKDVQPNISGLLENTFLLCSVYPQKNKINLKVPVNVKIPARVGIANCF